MHRERHTLNSRAAHTHSDAQLVEKCTSSCLPRVRRVNQCLDHTVQKRQTFINQRRSSGQSIKRNWTVVVVAAVVGCCCWRWCVLWQLCCLCVASAFVVLLTYNSFFGSACCTHISLYLVVACTESRVRHQSVHTRRVMYAINYTLTDTHTLVDMELLVSNWGQNKKCVNWSINLLAPC